MAASGSPILPGRLGTPDMTLRDDPRADPRMIAALGPFGLVDRHEVAPVNGNSPIDELLDYVTVAEAAFEQLNAALVTGLPEIDGVVRRVEIIAGVEGHDLTLFVHRPAAAGTYPGVLHLHGGAMVMQQAADPMTARWRDALAATGLVVVGVEFRNAGGKLGAHPYPAGLDDCITALRWMIDHRAELAMSKLLVSGESGGGNLTLATVLRAKRERLAGQIDGAYALCPYISNGWAAPPAALASLFENDGYGIDVSMMAALARVYDPSGEHDTDPLAWPLHATAEDLRGLPPHVISVNQLDPLRDEGLAYARKLLDAGVPVISRTVNGTCHAGEVILAGAMPDVFGATIRDIKGFADSL